MTRTKRIGLGLLALFCAVCISVGLASCRSKDTSPKYGYGEEGAYYYSVSEGEDCFLTLSGGAYVLDLGGESGTAGTYEWTDGEITLYEGEEETGYAYLTEGGISLTYDGRSYLFLTYEYYTVTFTDGSSTLTTQSVLNGKAPADPGEPEKEGCVFLGWYTDSAFTMHYEFNTAITADTTVYGRFVEAGSGAAEYKVTYDYTGDTAETINGVVYNLPTPERSGYTFLGWWVSATNNADELTYKYTDETLNEDTTLYAFFVQGTSYMGASVYDDRIAWENYSASVTDIILRDEDGVEIERFAIQSTDGEYVYDFASLPAGKYTLTIQGGGVDETLVYVSHALTRVSGFTVISGSILMYEAVENAEGYYIAIDCGTEGHDHGYVYNGTSLYYDFSSCEMPSTGITFTVYAYADGYYYSVSTFNYFLGLERAEVRVEDDTVRWDAVPYAMQYEVYINGELVATTYDTSWSLSGYGAMVLEIAVRPVTDGYWSEKSEAYMYNKKSLASPAITGIDNYVISWTEVEGATGYKVSINGVETTIDGGSVTSLILSDDNYTEGLDSYEISVKALAQDSNNDSPYGETITVTGTSVGSAVSYSNNTVTWQYSLSASEYRITVNDGDELIVTGTNSSPVTLTKSGNNEIAIYFVNDEGEIYGQASVTVYAYAIVFDARGGAVYDSDGNEIDTIYVAKGDTVTLPEAGYEGDIGEFKGWYTLPDLNEGDGDYYTGTGVLYEDGTVFTGNSTIVLYAFWSYRYMPVTLDSGDGTLEGGNTVEIKYNSKGYTIEVPEIADKVYAFVGWYTGENGTGTRYTDENGDALRTFDATSDMTLYAYWAEALSFEVTTSTYDGNDTVAVSKGSDINLFTEITVPEKYTLDGVEYGVTEITGSAFSSCTNLRTINIPDTMNYMNITSNGYASGSGIFASTPLENVNVYATGEPSTTKEITYYSRDGVLFQLDTTTWGLTLLYYPYGRTDETYSIPATASNENEYGFEGRNEVPVVRNVTAIGDSAFRGHDELTHMVIPENITAIGTYTFYNCTNLARVEFECEIEKIPARMFYGCSSLVDVEIPDGVKEIETYAFYDCESIVGIVIPDSVEILGTYVFYQCYALEHVELSSNLTVIDNYDFSYCTSLKGIEIPYSVTVIGNYAFRGCEALTSFTVPDSVTSLGTYVFYQCSALASVTLSANIPTVDNYAFYQCTSLRSIDIPEGVTTIGNYAFSGCTMLSSVSLPDSLTDIGKNAFENCVSLITIVIPANMESIGDYAFRYCYKLVEVVNLSELPITAGSQDYGYVGAYAVSIQTSVTGGSNITSDNGYSFIYDEENGEYSLFGYSGADTDLVLPADINGESYSIYPYAFYQNTAVTGIVMPDTVTGIGEYAFYGCSALRSINISEAVTSIGQYAFYGCASLTGINIPDGVTSIETYTFYGCSSLVSVVFPDSVTSIGNYAFNGCTSLVRVKLGTGMDSIGTSAFYNCYKLVEVCNASSMSLTAGASGNGYVVYYAKSVCSSDEDSRMIYEDGILYVYDDSGKYYAVGYYGDDGDIVFPSSVNGNTYEIYQYAFYGNASITSAKMTGGVTAIGQYAFYGCSGMKELVLNDDLSSIATYAFYGCASLKAVEIPGSVASIGTYAFYNCSGIEILTLNEGTASIGNYAFYGCSLIESLEIPESVTSIGERAFYNCSGIKELTLNEGLLTISDYAFYNCSSVTSLDIPGTVTTIGNYAFYNCSSVTSLDIPGTVTTIGNYAFYNCSSVKTLTLNEGLKTIGSYAFSGCSLIESVTIPDSVTSISDYAFQNCTSLSSITLPDGLTSLGRSIFENTAYFNDPSNYEDGLLYMSIYLMAVDDSVTGTLTVKEGTTIIAGYVFYNNSNVTEVILPESLVSIGDYAFRGSSIKSITIPEKVSYIGTYAFYSCTSLASVELLCDEVYVGTYCFNGCTALAAIDFSTAGAVDLDDRAFYGCTALTELNLEGVRSLGDRVFNNCTGLVYVEYASSITSAGSYMFSGSSNIKEVVLLEGELTFGSYAFSSNTSIEKVTVKGDTTGSSYTFNSCTGIKEVVICEGVTSLGNSYMFSGCSALETLVIPSTLTKTSNYCFSNCTSLTVVYYGGASSSDWNKISFGSSSSYVTNATRYYYSETEPALNSDGTDYDGNFWHWVNGEIVVWIKQ